MKFKMAVLAVAATAVFATTAVHAAAVKFGVTAQRGAVETKQQWDSFIKSMSEATGDTVELVPVTPDQIDSRMAAGDFDFVLANPVVTVGLVEKQQATPVATIRKPDTGSQFSGVILAKKGAGITKGEDLKGKNVMAFKFRSAAAAYVFQTYHLMQKGIDPHKDFASFREAKKQDDIVLSVKAGTIDAGFVVSGLIEKMAKEGKVSMDDFEIVDQKKDGFAYAHSTSLYPEWYVTARKDVESGTVGKVKTALMKIDPASDAAKASEVAGFVEPLDLTELKGTLKTLKLPPYDS